MQVQSIAVKPPVGEKKTVNKTSCVKAEVEVLCEYCRQMTDYPCNSAVEAWKYCSVQTN
jgi:hypothetical protein